MNDKTPAEKAAEILFTPGRVNTTKGCAAIIQAAIDETVRDVYSRAGYGPRPAEVNEMTEWQPIAICPRDGTHVLLWNAIEKEVHSMYFNTWNQCFQGVDDDAPWGDDHEYSHWMPSPQPPEDAR